MLQLATNTSFQLKSLLGLSCLAIVLGNEQRHYCWYINLYPYGRSALLQAVLLLLQLLPQQVGQVEVAVAGLGASQEQVGLLDLQALLLTSRTSHQGKQELT